jgi:HlyD family secretion protein
MNMKRKWWIVVGVAVLTVALALAGYQYVAAQKAAVQEPVGETAVVRRDTLEVVVEATGTLSPRAQVLVSFSSGGRVAEVFVAEGQRVEEGQALVQLETDELALQVAQAEAVLAAAEAQLAQVLAPPRPEEVALVEANRRAMEAQAAVASANQDLLVAGASSAQIAATEAQIASATAQQKSAFDRHERTMECFTVKLPGGARLPDGTILKESIERTVCPALGAPEEQARYALAAADASLVAARSQLDDLLAGADPEQVRAAQAQVRTATAQWHAAQAELELLLAGATPEQVQTLQASVDDARVALEQAQLRLEKATLVAPTAGTVSYLGVQPGEIANANIPIVALSDLATLEVDVSLDEADVTGVIVGQEAQLSLDAFPGVGLMGEVVDIAPAADVASGVVLYPVTIRLLAADPATDHAARLGQVAGQDLEPTVPVRAGMTTEVRIVTASREEALIVPLRAVETEGERAFVQRLAGGGFERVEVTLGLMTTTEVEITRGLTEGDVISVVPGPIQDPTSALPGPFDAMRGN